MVQARRKPETVEAVQWQSGVVAADLTESVTEVHYSEDGTWYYISRPGCRASHWLSTGTHDGEPTAEDKQKAAGYFALSLAQFKLKDGRTYWRRVLSFGTFKVRTGRVGPIGEATDLFLDYASVERWPEKPTPTAVIGRGTTNSQMVHAGDWIVTRADGTREVLADGAFREQYDLVGVGD